MTGTIAFLGYLPSDNNISGYSKEVEEISKEENEDSGAFISKYIHFIIHTFKYFIYNICFFYIASDYWNLFNVSFISWFLNLNGF